MAEIPVTTIDVTTTVGPARVRLERPRGPRLLVVLGHGAGGGIEAPDLSAVAAALGRHRVAVARVEQPYRVAGRRAPAPAGQLDTAWREVVAELRRDRVLRRLPVVTGGRSSGARVACRTAGDVAAVGVVALAFPLHSPGKDASRLPELVAVPVPVLVVQGERDPFGGPGEFSAGGQLPSGVTVEAVPGDHSLRASAGRAAELVLGWLGQLDAAT
jgi:predicted alpha/beta-hydrolase family hydrolase